MVSKQTHMKPQLTPELAEIVGIMLGDGSLCNKYNNTYRIIISLNLEKEFQYAIHIMTLFESVFHIYLKILIDKKKNSLTLYCYSKKLFIFMKDCLAIPTSPKQIQSIPLSCKNSFENLQATIRGIFDTDGCVTHQKDKSYFYVLLKITTQYHKFASDIRKSLLKLGINSYICKKKDRDGYLGYDVTIRHFNTKKFMKIIGSNNPRNLKRWEQLWGRWDSNS